jgi:hypothetical protein
MSRRGPREQVGAVEADGQHSNVDGSQPASTVLRPQQCEERTGARGLSSPPCTSATPVPDDQRSPGIASVQISQSIRGRAATAAEAGLSGCETPPPRILSPQAMLPQARTQPQTRAQPQPMLLPSDRAMTERYKVSPGLFDRGPPTDPMPTRQQMPPGTRSPVMLDSSNARTSQDKVRRAERPASCLRPDHPTSHYPHQHSHHPHQHSHHPHQN